MKLNEVAKHLPRLLTVAQFADMLMEMNILPHEHEFTDKDLAELIVRARNIAMPNMSRLHDHLLVVSNKLAEANYTSKCVGTRTQLELGSGGMDIVLIAEASHDNQWLRIEDDDGKDVTTDYLDSMELPPQAVDYIIQALNENLERTINGGAHPLEEDV